MNKETHDIPITLVLPRYEVMAMLHALRRWADSEREKGFPSAQIMALSDKISKTTREHIVAFENQE